MTLIQTEPKKICMVQPSRLPSEYQEVEYIESTGTQYFTVGTSFKTSYKIEIDLEMTAILGDYVPVGVRSSSNYKIGINVWQSYFKVIAGADPRTDTIAEDTNRHTVIIDKSTATVDGTNYSISYSNYTFSYGLGVFYYNTGSTPSTFSSNKLYKLDIYDENGVHIYDLVPCYRKQDTEIGMYDLVNDTFYTNSGSGTFTKGNDVNFVEQEIKRVTIRPNGTEKQIRPVGGLPAAYQEVEYIQSSGTQLIDTGYLITPNTEVAVDYQFTNAGDQDFCFGIGSDSTTSSGVTFCMYCSGSAFKAGISDGTKSGTWDNYLGSKNTNRHTFVLNNGTFSMYNSSGTLENTTSTSLTFTRTAEHSFGLFCWWRTDLGTPARSNKTAAKLYGCTVKENGTSQRNFVPCYRIADSVVGLYDTVNSQFYTNAGTGTFTKGPDVN